jgi:hypothetical protein
MNADTRVAAYVSALELQRGLRAIGIHVELRTLLPLRPPEPARRSAAESAADERRPIVRDCGRILRVR